MTIERAIEILDPEHREHYDSIKTIEEACRMGMKALQKQIPTPPEHCASDVKDEIEDLYCPKCGYYYNLHNVRKTRNKVCGFCGQALDWGDIE